MFRRMAHRRCGALCICCSTAIAGLVVLPAADHVAAAVVTITVTTTSDDHTVNGNCTLREAVDASNRNVAVDACPAGGPADQIVLARGPYQLSIAGPGEDADLTGDLDVQGTLTISGLGSVIDAGGIDRVIHVLPTASLTVIGVTLQGGYIQVNDDPAVLGNVAGGGVLNEHSLILQDSTVTGNVADVGATGPAMGAGVASDGFLTLTRAHIVGNSMGNTLPQGNGGGIANLVHGQLSMNDTTVSGNRAWDLGGGIYNNGGLTGAGNTVSANITGCSECSSEGGGIYNHGNVTLTDSTISSNAVDAGDFSGSASGGGISAAGLTFFRNVTIADNSVTHLCDTHCFTTPTGGGIAATDTTTILNTIVSDNTVTENQSPPNGGGSATAASDCTGTITTEGFNLVHSVEGCGFVPSATDLVGVDPLLGPLQGNGGLTWTHNLSPGSPAIDAADPAAASSGGTSCPPRDQRGMPRSDDGNFDGTQRCDIGAVEAPALDSTSRAVRFDVWSGTNDAAASGGGYRSATSAGAAATFTATLPLATTTVSFMTFKGPNMGRATVVADGVPHTLDLYAAGAAVRTTLNFTVPAAKQHTVKVTVLGTKNVASSGTQVRVAGFKHGDQVFDDTSPSIRYGSWSGGRNALALNGSFRLGVTGGTVAFDTIGPVFTLITERGPSFGKAQVTIDGAPRGTVDYYAPAPQWLSRQRFSGLGAGTHHVVIKVLGTKNAASTGTSIAFDAVTFR